MPSIHDMKESKYLGKVDVKTPIRVTVDRCEKVDISKEDDAPDIKWTMYFREDYKPLILNWTNMQLMERATGEENSDDWTGKQVVLYNDPTVMYKGELKGGVRVQIPQQQVPPPTHGGVTEAQKQQIDNASAALSRDQAKADAEHQDLGGAEGVDSSIPF